MARWLAEQGFPAVRAYAGVAQPVEAAGRPVTFWEFAEGRNGDRGDSHGWSASDQQLLARSGAR